MNHKLLTHLLLLTLLLLSSTSQAQFWKKQQDALLPDHQAFLESAERVGNTLNVSWQIADDYYMYRDQFSVVPITAGLKFGAANYPEGVIEDDPEFGEVVVYFRRIEYSLPISELPSTGDVLEFELKGQGCNKPVGVCYAPQTRLVSIGFDPSSVVSDAKPETETIASGTDSNTKKSIWGYLTAAFGVGLLLSLTACVLPMIPILAGVIANQQNPSQMKSGWLSICYVMGTVVTNAIAGALVALSGAQLQAFFQSPVAIGIICSILILLAFSLFGAFKIQLPSSLQTKLSNVTVTTKSASISTFSLGLVSALVVGACVSPVLIGLLTIIIQSGDPIFGALLMSFVALGLGTPLIVFGFGAGWLLPKTGAWMNQIQVLFGFMVLGVAIFIASALPSVPSLYLWSALLLWAGSYLLRFASELLQPLIASLLKAMGVTALIWGTLALIGATTGGTQILSPLETLQLSNAGTPNNRQSVKFKVVKTQAEAQSLLDQARASGQPSLVDFYADWCLDCKRMDRTTFSKQSVVDELRGWQLIKIDVTDTNDNSQAVKQHFNVFGPPATLFFKANGSEVQALRQYGYLDESEFLELARALKR